MGDAKLFHLGPSSVSELMPSSVAVEKSLQNLIERHLDTFLGVRFLASEHQTSKKHGGRIDTIGIDEIGSPVIIEYKRSLNENVINQGLFYLDWLLDHKADFKVLVLDRFGAEVMNSIDWRTPRLLCIAGDFTKYDEHAVNQIGRNIELIRYRRYGNEFLLLELVNVLSKTVEEPVAASQHVAGGKPITKKSTEKTVAEKLEQSSPQLRDRYDTLENFITSLGDDIQKKVLQNYFAFRRLKNFACVEVSPQLERLSVFVKADIAQIQLEKDFTRDIRNIGTYSTGDLEISIRNDHDLERAKPYIVQSYETN